MVANESRKIQSPRKNRTSARPIDKADSLPKTDAVACVAFLHHSEVLCMALTVTKRLILPSPVPGSGPRPRWFDVSMWAKPLDTCMLDIRFREKFQDALAVVISDEERAGLDILTHGDFHCDEDFAGRSWHHYPIQRWTGFEG